PGRMPAEAARGTAGRGVEALASASQHAPLLRCVAEFGDDAIPHLLARLDDPSPDARCWAVALFAVLRHPPAVGRIVARVFDTDGRTAHAAVEVLRRYRTDAEFAAAADALA